MASDTRPALIPHQTHTFTPVRFFGVRVDLRNLIDLGLPHVAYFRKSRAAPVLG